MATTGILNGTLLGIYVGGTLVAHSTSNSISITHSPRSATSKDSGGWSDNLEGLREWSAEGEGYMAFDASYGLNDLVTLYENRTKVLIRFSTEVSGDEYFQGYAYLDSLSVDSSPEESATFSYSLTGTGALNNKSLT